MEKNNRKTINAWAMYDWANSTYALVITSAIFPAYYNAMTRHNGSSRVELFGYDFENSAIYSICLGIAFGVIALLSPFLSSIADYTSKHKLFMRIFCYLGSAACASLFFFDRYELYPLALAGLMLATIGYSGSIVFYNSFLPVIATEDQQDRVSAKGYAFGYLGATTLLLFNLAAILNQEFLGITDNTLLPRIAFLTTGLWWFGFAHITFAKLPSRIYGPRKETHWLWNGYLELVKVWKTLNREKRLRTFLLSFFFYIMGVQTVMFMAASYGEKEIHLGVKELIFTVLILEYIGIAGAFLFAALSKRWGNFRALTLAVVVWIGICIGGYFIQTPLHFYLTAFSIGLVMGGIQSLSRSTFAKMMPKTENNAGYFSFYDVCEKMAMMCGLILFGYMENWTGSMRNSIIALGLWFTIGLFFLIRVQLMSSPGRIK
ncbi:MAG: MFS transporter [Saprospirales bacterium]|nr:MFS transporter [Saprospirales bacterium]